MVDDREVPDESSPATRLLDALGRGDLNAAMLEFRPTTIVRTEDRSWLIQGEEEVLGGLDQALDHFPGLVFDSHARHIGYGQVIEEARVRDLGPSGGPDGGGGEVADGHVDGAGAATGEGRAGNRALVLDRDFGKSDHARLNMPLRVTVMHDDRYVHEIILSFPSALLRAALGLRVDPLDMAMAEIQSAFVAPVGSGFKTYQMGSKPPPLAPLAAPTAVPVVPEVHEPEPELVPEPEPEPVAYEPVHLAQEPEPEPEPEPLTDEPWSPPPFQAEDEPRRRALLIVPVVIVLVAAIAGSTWWLGRGDGGAAQADQPTKPGHSATQPRNDDTKPTKKPSTSPSPSEPVATKTDKPTVTLKSDLAFDKNSAALSNAAKVEIAKLARQVKRARLHGTITVNGYTDNLGSASYGLELSKQRAQAVAKYLRSRLNGYRINIVAVGYGEAHPIASNKTEAGRKQNRRVTITLPKN